MKFHLEVHTVVPYLKLGFLSQARYLGFTVLGVANCRKNFLEKYINTALCIVHVSVCYVILLVADADLSELTTANPTLMYKLQNKLSKLLTHNVMQSPSVKDLLYESGCLSDEEIANSEATKDTQQSQYITAVLQSKNLATIRELIQFLVSRKEQEASEKLLLIFSDGLSKGTYIYTYECMCTYFCSYFSAVYEFEYEKTLCTPYQAAARGVLCVCVCLCTCMWMCAVCVPTISYSYVVMSKY